jgi:hypothetical protein
LLRSQAPQIAVGRTALLTSNRIENPPPMTWTGKPVPRWLAHQIMLPAEVSMPTVPARKTAIASKGCRRVVTAGASITGPGSVSGISRCVWTGGTIETGVRRMMPFGPIVLARRPSATHRSIRLATVAGGHPHRDARVRTLASVGPVSNSASTSPGVRLRIGSWRQRRLGTYCHDFGASGAFVC